MSEDRKETASRCREAVEARLSGEPVEAAGQFKRSGGSDFGEPALLLDALHRAYEKVAKGRLGRFPGRFLLAVTSDAVYAFKYQDRHGNLVEVGTQLAVFDRDDIRIAGSREALLLYATEHGRTHDIELDAKVLDESPGAIEVIAALSYPEIVAALSE
jgi:hypothetical protein